MFDQTTLFTVATSITALLGVFLLVLWLQERSIRALAWWGGAYLVGAGAVMLWHAQDTLDFIAPEMPNALLFVACGMMWTGARLFHGRAAIPGALFGGAAIWFVSMQIEGFAASDEARAMQASLIIALYAFLTAYELRRARRNELAGYWR